MIKVDHGALLLEVKGITKSFAGVRALKGVDLQVVAGEVHCVLGQNGAGKSTLIKILAGVYLPDGGEILWQGKPLVISDPLAAIRLGIATMYQELDVVEGLTVAENIFLGHEFDTFGMLRTRRANRAARAILNRLGHGDISPNIEVALLSPASKQIVSMARALSHDIKLIIMDEPSAVLDSEEVKNLFRVIRELTASGIAVVYISHRLAEIREIGDRITVLKDGASMANGLTVAETSTKDVITLMTGRTIENLFARSAAVASDAEVVLRVDGLSILGEFSNVSFTARAGEVVGLAGLVGSGRSEILEAIYGARKTTAGSVSVGSRRLQKFSVPDAVDAGIGFSPEERKSQGLLLDEPVYKNVTLSSFARFARLGFLRESAERNASRAELVALETRPADPDLPARALSGGNQQKLLLARWLVHGTRVLLLDEPTRGVDVGARAEIYALIRSLAQAGTAIVIVSSEIEEVLGLSDTVLVIADGRIVATALAGEIDEPEVLDLVMKDNAA